MIALALAAGMLTAMLLHALPAKVSAASPDEIRSQIDELESQQAELQEQMDALEAQMSDNLTQIEDMIAQKGRIDQQIFLLHDQIGGINEQISAYNVLIADKQDELTAAEARYEALSDKYRERVRAMEEAGELSYWSVLFKANSFTDLLDRLNMIREIAASDERRLQELNDAAQAVKAARDALEQGKTELQTKRTALSGTQSELEAKRAESDKLLSNLIARGKEFERQMLEGEDKQTELMLQLAQRNDELELAEYEQWLSTSVPPETAAGGGGNPPLGEGEWMVPVPWYVLCSPFGMRLHPIYNVWRMHYGVDLGCDQGEPIYASRSGVVTVTDYEEDGAGNYVYINHGDGYTSIYMHMTYYIVSAGDYVTQGQVIGYVGDTGAATGAHLHFGITYNGTYVNPMDYIG